MHELLTKFNDVKHMSLNMLKILVALNEKGPMQPIVIAYETGLSERTVFHLRGKAVHKGMIKKTAGSDRRTVVYELSEEIKKLFN